MLDRVDSLTHYEGSKALMNIATTKLAKKLPRELEQMQASIVSFYSLVGNCREFSLVNFETYSMPKNKTAFYKNLTLLIMRYPEKTDEMIENENRIRKAKQALAYSQPDSIGW